jgi:hypothetical protein
MLDFRLKLANADKERRRILLAEVDRGTETNIEVFKQKIRAYVHYALPGGVFEEQELDHEYNLFRFTLVEQVRTVEKDTGKEKISEELAIDPYTFFLTEVAFKPYHKEQDALLWKP